MLVANHCFYSFGVGGCPCSEQMVSSCHEQTTYTARSQSPLPNNGNHRRQRAPKHWKLIALITTKKNFFVYTTFISFSRF
jgi:hypothetical protein